LLDTRDSMQIVYDSHNARRQGKLRRWKQQVCTKIGTLLLAIPCPIAKPGT
jgi:hypothetical protein